MPALTTVDMLANGQNPYISRDTRTEERVTQAATTLAKDFDKLPDSCKTLLRLALTTTAVVLSALTLAAAAFAHSCPGSIQSLTCGPRTLASARHAMPGSIQHRTKLDWLRGI
jgi:hypothetical protein